MPKRITEATPAAIGEATDRGTVPIVIASPGWGSSGWYSPQVLENAVTAKVFGKSLHMYMDHPGEQERHDRPERSLRDLVGTLSEDATWDPERGIVGEAKIFGPYRELFKDKDFVDAIGVSLRAFADTTIGEAEGRKGTIITDLLEAQSVDFVTKAGRGGKVMAALESAREADANYDRSHYAAFRQIYRESSVSEDELFCKIVDVIENDGALAFIDRTAEGRDLLWAAKAATRAALRTFAEAAFPATESDRATLREARANDTREALHVAVKAAHGGEDTYTWVRDFDPDQGLVFFEVEDEDSMTTYQQGYELADDGTAALTGQPAEVRATTSYVPVVPDTASTDDVGEAVREVLASWRPTISVPAPAGQPTATESRGDEMATTQIEETALAALRQDAERVPTLESERDTAIRERDELREAAAVQARTDAARVVIQAQAREAGVTFTGLEERGLLAGLPVTEAGELDTEAYTATVTEAAAAKAAESGAGSITGFGATHTTSDGDVVREAETAAAGAFGRTIKEA